ncbi:MAG: L-rhamnose mutarotase [Planctomycetia bacterium]|nr:L-rhamnose mutarotase [Planctomycetia bacterium]
MIRRAFTMRLKPNALAEYKRYHDNIWPELVAEIERSGIASITTFQRDLDLFLVSEIADEAAWDKLWNSEVHKRWAEVMQPLMHLRDDGIVEAGELAEVFHLTTNSNGGVSAEVVAVSDMTPVAVAERIAESIASENRGDEFLAEPAPEATPQEPSEPAVKPGRKMARRKTKKSADKKKTPAKKVHRKQATKSRRPKPRPAGKATKKAAKKSIAKKSAAKKAAKKKSTRKKR